MAKLKSVTFGKYKAFSDSQTLEVRPITLLFGHNSVGKSAALRLLPILARSAHSGLSDSYSPTVLNYQAPALRGASFIEIANRGTRSPGLNFALQWENCRLDVTIRQIPASSPAARHEVVSDFTVEVDADRMQASLVDPEGELYEVSGVGAGPAVRIPFQGLHPQLPDGTNATFKSFHAAVRTFTDSVHWLAAVRAQPPRLFTLEPGGSARIKSDGSGTAEALWISALREDGVAAAVSDWLKGACGCELSFAATDAQVFHGKQWFPFQVQTAGTAVAVADVGEGISQALPVVALCRQAAAGLLGPNPILALEQPELHLHPGAATSLAEEVVACVAGGSLLVPARRWRPASTRKQLAGFSPLLHKIESGPRLIRRTPVPNFSPASSA